MWAAWTVDPVHLGLGKNLMKNGSMTVDADGYLVAKQRSDQDLLRIYNARTASFIANQRISAAAEEARLAMLQFTFTPARLAMLSNKIEGKTS